MILIPSSNLDKATASALQALQDRVNQYPDYATQVSYAKDSWGKKPRPLFKGLKVRLTQMCSGNERCVYCEDSQADEVEHMRPKDLYPEQTYAWSNYVLACGPCNGPKNNRFAVLGHPLELIDITRRPKAAVVQPATGPYALIDPRVEDPVDLLWLDFRTWRYVPNADDETSEAWIRAEYSIEVLGLNKRDALVRGRKSAFSGYIARLKSWQEYRGQRNAEDQKSFIEDFRMERYRGVWERMKRYRNDLALLKEVAELIEASPEVLDW